MNHDEFAKSINDAAIADGLKRAALTAVGDWLDWLETHPSEAIWATAFGHDGTTQDIFECAELGLRYRVTGLIRDYSPVPLTERQTENLADFIVSDEATLLQRSLGREVQMHWEGSRGYKTGRITFDPADDPQDARYVFRSTGGLEVRFAVADVTAVCMTTVRPDTPEEYDALVVFLGNS